MSEAAHAGRFAIYVVWAYAISAAVLAALAAETLLRGWRWRRRAAKAQDGARTKARIEAPVEAPVEAAALRAGAPPRGAGGGGAPPPAA